MYQNIVDVYIFQRRRQVFDAQILGLWHRAYIAQEFTWISYPIRRRREASGLEPDCLSEVEGGASKTAAIPHVEGYNMC